MYKLKLQCVFVTHVLALKVIFCDVTNFMIATPFVMFAKTSSNSVELIAAVKLYM